MITEWAEMAYASLGLGGFAALWVAKAIASLACLRVWRRWRLRRALLRSRV